MKNREQASIQNRLRYAFDKTLSRGPLALGGWVALVSLVILLVLSLVLYFGGLNPDMGLPETLWTMLMQALAPNPVSFGGSWEFLLAMLIITLLGIFMVSIFIGIIATAIDSKIQSLREGRSQVIEKDHTIILGWDEHIFTIISELMIANLGKRHASIVIMSDKDKIEMEDEIRSRVHPTGRTEVVCRRGSPIEMSDLEIISVNRARSIIILPPDGEEPDTYIIKALLAIMNNPKRRSLPYHIVTEIQQADNLEVTRLVGKDETVTLLVSDIIAHIIAQTCRQSGLSMVYTELMNFEGDEIYFKEEPSLVGKTFGETLFLYEDSSVIGLRPVEGSLRLNPPMDTRIAAGDDLIVIAADGDSIHLSGKTLQSPLNTFTCTRPPASADPEATLILGWNLRGATIIEELDHYVAPGSRVKVVANQAGPQADVLALQAIIKNQAVSFQSGPITERRLLLDLCREGYDHMIVLAEMDGESIQLADARTLITLLNLRDIKQKSGQKFSIVSEMLDVRNRNLAEVTHVDDFIVSDELSSLLMAQISENKELYLVFEDLFNSEGSEIYLKPAAEYVTPGQTVNFYSVIESARQRCEVAIGYRQAARAIDAQQAFGVVVNPEKSKSITFQDGDRIIVLAEN